MISLVRYHYKGITPHIYVVPKNGKITIIQCHASVKFSIDELDTMKEVVPFIDELNNRLWAIHREELVVEFSNKEAFDGFFEAEEELAEESYDCAE